MIWNLGHTAHLMHSKFIQSNLIHLEFYHYNY